MRALLAQFDASGDKSKVERARNISAKEIANYGLGLESVRIAERLGDRPKAKARYKQFLSGIRCDQRVPELARSLPAWAFEP